MKKISLMLAAGVLCLSGSAFAGEKVESTTPCCRADDADCTDVYQARCEGSVGYFCSSTSAEGDGTAKVEWTINCTESETCTNTGGRIECVAEGQCSSADNFCYTDGRNGGQRCKDGEMVEWTCDAGETCSMDESGWLSCVLDLSDDEIPTGACSADAADAAGCNTEKTIGWYCNNDGEYQAKSCANCTVNPDRANSVSCDEGGESGDGCTSADNFCYTDGRNGGQRCKNGEMVEWTCDAGETCSVDAEGWMSCNGGSSSGDGCTSADNHCYTDGRNGGQRCKNGEMVEWTCNEGQTCAIDDTGWLSCVDGAPSTTPGDGTGDTASCTESCSSEGSIAYNCVDGQKVQELCSPGTCQMNGTDAVCVAGAGSSGSKDDKEDDSGCSATGAGFLLGWMGLAILPALRRRQK